MRKIILFTLLLAVAGCRTIKQNSNDTQVEYRDRLVYVDKVVHDSIFEKEVEKEYIKGDTVYKDHYITRYKEKVVHDTAFVCRTDTVRVEKIQEKIVEVKKQTFLQKLFGIIGLVSSILIILYALWRFYLKR